MGKSSLRVRTVRRLRADGVACAMIDLTLIGSTDTTPEEWYAGIIDIVANDLNLGDFDLDEWWERHSRLSPVHHFGKFIEEIVLKEIP